MRSFFFFFVLSTFLLAFFHSFVIFSSRRSHYHSHHFNTNHSTYIGPIISSTIFFHFIFIFHLLASVPSYFHFFPYSIFLFQPFLPLSFLSKFVNLSSRPLSSKEEMKIKKTNRESLLSEVFFGAAVSISHEEPPRISVASPPGFSPSSPSSNNSSSATNSPTFNFKSVAYENHRDRNKRFALQRLFLFLKDTTLNKWRRSKVPRTTVKIRISAHSNIFSSILAGQ